MHKLTTKEFIQRSNLKHNNYYNYDKTIYIGNKNKVIITCKIHGDFEQRPSDHTAGAGCLICGQLKSQKTQTKNVILFIEQANTIHNNQYLYSNINYVNNSTKITITCKNHGTFNQTPNDHLKGRGCPICNQTRSNKYYKNQQTLLYYVKFPNGIYKIGLARKSLNYRFKGCEKPKLLMLWEFLDGSKAYEIEKLVLKQIKQIKYNGPFFISPYGISAGETECSTQPFMNNIFNTIQEKNYEQFCTTITEYNLHTKWSSYK